jgi:hypothetical protein
MEALPARAQGRFRKFAANAVPLTLQAHLLKVVGEVAEEVADAGVVAVAVDDLALEMLLVVLQLFLDVAELCVKLVLFGDLGCLETAVLRCGS